MGSIVLLAGLAVFLLPPLRALPSSHRAASASLHPTAASASSGPLQASLPGLEAITGLKYQSGPCPPNAPCLHLVNQTTGVNAAALQFATAASAGRACEAFVYRDPTGWHYLNAVCALPDQLAPVVGQAATVHIPGDCAKVRIAASLGARVADCLKDGTPVRVDGGPDYADGKLWWHLQGRGWMAHDFLLGAS